MSAATPVTNRRYARQIAQSLACMGLWVAGVLGILVACQAIYPRYDALDHAATNRLALDADALLARATEPFAAHEVAVESVRWQLAERALVAKRQSHRHAAAAAVASQWELLARRRSAGGDLLAAMLDDWEAVGTLNARVLGYQRRIVAEAFRAIMLVEQQQPYALPDSPAAGEARLFPEGAR